MHANVPFAQITRTCYACSPFHHIKVVVISSVPSVDAFGVKRDNGNSSLGIGEHFLPITVRSFLKLNPVLIASRYLFALAATVGG